LCGRHRTLSPVLYENNTRWPLGTDPLSTEQLSLRIVANRFQEYPGAITDSHTFVVNQLPAVMPEW